MDEGHENGDRMDVEWTRDAASRATPLGSPSYSPPGLEARIEGKGAEEGGHGHDEADEGDDEEGEEEETARCKAKGKAKAKTSYTTPVPIPDIDTYTNPSSHRPRSVLSSHPTEAHHSAQDSIHEKHFADADVDAAMNDALPPPTSSSSHPPSSYPPIIKHHKPFEHAPPPPPPRNFAAQPAFSTELMAKLKALQRSPQPYQRHRGDGGRGRGWGRGRGLGGELRWRGTMTREKIESEGWGACDEADAASMERGEMGWEVYDEVVWERAGEGVGLEVPRASGSVEGASAGGEGGLRARVDAATAGKVEGEPEESRRSRRGELVRAVRGYRAILSGTFLSYGTDEVLEVVHRDGDGKAAVFSGSAGDGGC